MRAVIAIPITLLVDTWAYTRGSLTLPGILVATLTATLHALHPSALPFTLLFVFFVVGTAATKVKHKRKATLTLSSSGSAGGEGPRTSVQVLANSACASILCAVHVWLYGTEDKPGNCFGGTKDGGPVLRDVLLWGIMANYVSVAADTLSSELGILSTSSPVLITNPFRVVPRGTNGGVTAGGLLAGIGGSAVLAATSLPLLSLCTDSSIGRLAIFIALTALGTVGTLLDSLLGATLQASVVDRRSGKVIEGPGGIKVLVKSRAKSQPSSPGHERKVSGEESRIVNSGVDLLDNNQINFLMACIMSVAGMAVGSVLQRQ
jgi:uncharacterized protein (TIGR00297 family)